MGNGTSIGKVRGAGSAHHGSQHWMVQRFTAIGNLLLVLWLVASLLLLPDFTYGTVMDWISGVVPSTLMALLLISSFWHARLGMQVMIEDYVHEAGNKFACMLLLNFAAIAGMAFGLMFVARIVMSAVGHQAAAEVTAQAMEQYSKMGAR